MIPHVLGAASCAALPGTGAGGQPARCVGRVEWVGVIRVRRPGRPLEAWLMFACAEHVHELPLLGTRQLLDRDRAVLARWHTELARWDHPPGHPDRPGPHGRPYDPPAPLATGEAAAVLLSRAQRARP